MLSREIIEKYKYDAQGLAKYFASEYFKTHDRVFPLNPFQVLSDLGIHFVFRNFEKLEGLFLPATQEEGINFVAINANRPITRQRFFTTHEPCHYLKDSGNTSFMCAIASDDYIEKYAEAFASAFLMPEDEIQSQIALRGRSEGLTLDDGTGTDRTILSGIHAFYEPEELVGKTLLAITNLPPRPMMGIESCGMLISAVNGLKDDPEGEELHLIMLDNHIPADAKMY